MSRLKVVKPTAADTAGGLQEMDRLASTISSKAKPSRPQRQGPHRRVREFNKMTATLAIMFWAGGVLS
jgi:hypothetical protein